MFGATVSARDTNGDGYADLAIGAYGEAIGDLEYAGCVHLLLGGSTGLSGTGSRWFDRSTAGIPGEVSGDDYFGSVVRLRDTDRDGDGDLYIGGTPSVRLNGTPTSLQPQGPPECRS